MRARAASWLLGLALPFAVAGCPALLTDDFRIVQDAGIETSNSDDGWIDQTTLSQDGATDVASDARGVLDSPIADNSNEASLDAASDVATNSDATIEAGCDASVCGGSCINLGTDDSNCGACGYACVHGRHCVAGRCTPVWLPISTVNAPTPRETPGAALGGQLILAGGDVGCSGSLASAAAYDPNGDTWSSLPNLNIARSQHVVVSSGTYVYTFGGLTDCANGGTQIGSLEEWKPGDANWTLIGAASAPAARFAFDAAWTGSGLFVFAGASGTGPTSSGAIYNPSQNAWSDASCALGGCLRNGAPSLTIVDHGFIRLWGGGSPGTGLQYEITSGVWSTWTPPPNFPTNAYVGGGEQTAPADDGRRIYFPTGGGSGNLNMLIYDRATQTQSSDTATSPVNMSAAGAIAWTGAEVVLWSGTNDAGVTSAGGRYQPPAP
jgi:hypothetical protein